MIGEGGHVYSNNGRIVGISCPPWWQSSRVLLEEKWRSNIRQCVSVGRKFCGLKRRQANQSFDRLEANPKPGRRVSRAVGNTEDGIIEPGSFGLGDLAIDCVPVIQKSKVNLARRKTPIARDGSLGNPVLLTSGPP